MRKYITIHKDPSIKVQSTIHEYMTPFRLYLPIHEQAKLLVKSKKICKNDALFEENGQVVYSPVSGTIEKIEKRKNGLSQIETYLVLQNNFKEEDHYCGVDHTTMMLTKDLKKKIREYKKEGWSSLKNAEQVILLGIEDEPYVANTSFIFRFHGREILLMLDALASSYSIGSIQIILKETDRDSIEVLEPLLNIYPKIQLSILPDYYLLGKPFFLKEYLHYQEDVKVFFVQEILEAYYDLFKLRKMDFLYFTFTGNQVVNPQVFKVKIGTPLKDILKEIRWNGKNYDLVVNGLMMGKKCDENLVLTKDIRVIYGMKKSPFQEGKCISCGKCNEVCPLLCNPYKSIQTKGKYQDSRCISCGLCSYICPVHVSFANYLKGESHE